MWGVFFRVCRGFGGVSGLRWGYFFFIFLIEIGVYHFLNGKSWGGLGVLGIFFHQLFQVRSHLVRNLELRYYSH